jgi:hypothetical protein
MKLIRIRKFPDVNLNKYSHVIFLHRIVPDLKNVAYKSGMRMGGQADYDFLYSKYLTAHMPSEVSLIINALGASKNPDVLKKCVFLRNI